MSGTSYDIIVIGAGPGGYTAAIRAAQLGLKTAVVEMDDRMGGTCLLRGCIPTKALLHAADILSELKSASRCGIRVGDVQVDFPQVMKGKALAVTRNAKGIELLFQNHGIVVERGRARLVDAHNVSVELGGETREIRAGRAIILAMGSRPAEIGAFPVDGRHILSSDHILDIPELPGRLAVLGAGAVGTEFASAFQRLGSKVALIEMLPRVLPLEDAQVSAELEKALHKQGIDVRTAVKLKSCKVVENEVHLKLSGVDGEDSLIVDRLLVAIGRTPNSADCGLEAAGVEMDGARVKVDDMYQTSLQGVHAIGDLLDTPMLAHCASAEAIAAVEHIAGYRSEPVNYALIPSATYCRPEVASVGLSEERARQEGYEIEVGQFPWAASGKARIIHELTGFVKIIRDAGTDRLLGIHIIGPSATDLIGEACALLNMNCLNRQLGRMVHPHPSLNEAILEASHAAAGHPMST